MNLYEFVYYKNFDDNFNGLRSQESRNYQIPAESLELAYLGLGRVFSGQNYELVVVSVNQVQGSTDVELSDESIDRIMDRYDNTECNSDESIVRKILNSYNYVKVKS